MSDEARKPAIGIHDQAGPAPTAPKPVRYRRPADLQRSKTIVALGKTDLVRAVVQVVRDGGETNLHAHTGMDLFYFVLAGRARFYGPGDVVIGEFAAHEGVIIPRGSAYWFESCGDVALELLQIGSFDPGTDNRRVDHQARTRVLEDTPVIDAS